MALIDAPSDILPPLDMSCVGAVLPPTSTTPGDLKAMTDTLIEVPEQTGGEEANIRPFRVSVPDADLQEMRRRIEATRWRERETVADASQGVQLATMQKLARYWATEYDWRKVEARLNALPQFLTEIDGVDIHFIHVRSAREDALPMILTHGWPGSVIE